MTTALTDQLMRDEWEMRRLAYLYAGAGDGNDPETFASIFTEDAVVVSPQATIEGRANLARIPGMLNDMFAKTMHTVMNQTVKIDGDKAEGETYCIAYHMHHPKGGKSMRYVMFIRYQDRFRRENGAWMAVILARSSASSTGSPLPLSRFDQSWLPPSHESVRSLSRPSRK